MRGWAPDQFKSKRFSSFMVHCTTVHLFRSADPYRKVPIHKVCISDPQKRQLQMVRLFACNDTSNPAGYGIRS